MADGWEQRYRRRSFEVRLRTVRRLLERVPKAGSEWLDAGCGTGTFARWLAGEGCRVTGVDASQAMLGRAKAIVGEDCGNPAFRIVETIESLPFVDNAFDGIICSSVIEYVADPLRALHEFRRVLRPGGSLVISVPNRQSLLRIAQKVCFRISGRFSSVARPGYLRFSRHAYDSESAAKCLREQGFEVLRRVLIGSTFDFLDQLRLVGSLIFLFARNKKP